MLAHGREIIPIGARQRLRAGLLGEHVNRLGHVPARAPAQVVLQRHQQFARRRSADMRQQMAQPIADLRGHRRFGQRQRGLAHVPPPGSPRASRFSASVVWWSLRRSPLNLWNQGAEDTSLPRSTAFRMFGA